MQEIARVLLFWSGPIILVRERFFDCLLKTHRAKDTYYCMGIALKEVLSSLEVWGIDLSTIFLLKAKNRD